MSQYYRNLIERGKLLDIYPNAAVAYSLRRLRSAYNGNVIRVRRDGDNAEQDFGFNGDFVDTNSIVSFVGDNKWTYSQDFTNAVYAKTGVSVTSDTTTAPDGTTTADSLFEAATTGNHRINRSTGTMVIDLNYTSFIHVKANGRTFIKLFSQVTNTLRSCVINLTTGAITSNTHITPPTVTNVGNGWWKITLTSNAGTTSTANGLLIGLMTDATTESYAGDITKGVYLWGAQFTQSSTPQNYIATKATTGGSGFIATWYDQSGNSIDATQTTVSSQCQIVDIVTPGKVPEILKDPSTNKVSTYWTSDTYALSSPISLQQKMIQVMVFNRVNNASYIIGLGNNATPQPTMLYWNTSNNLQSILGTTIVHFPSDSTLGANLVTTLRDGSNTMKMWKNGIAGATGTATNISNSFSYLGKLASPQNSGWFNEIVLWKQDYESLRTGIEQNINSYYGIY